MKRCLFIFLVAGCSYTWDSEAPDIKLLGGPPNTDALPRLNHSSAGADYLVLGYDDNGNQNAYWVAFSEQIPTGNGDSQSGLRAVRLTPPEKEEVIVADEVTPGWTRFFLVNHDPNDPKAPPTLTIRSAGQMTPPKVFELPGSPGLIGISYDESAFIYWINQPMQKTYFTFRSDGTFARTLPIPDGVDPTSSGIQFDWSAGSHYLVARDPKGDVTVHSTLELVDIDLGQRPSLIGTYGDDLLITCGADGVRKVNILGTGEQVLDPMPCDEHGGMQIHHQEDIDWLYFGANGELLRVPFDGSGPPEVVLQNGLRPLAFLSDGRIMFSKTPADQFVNSAGDGWLGDWKFMERGLDAGLSSDNSKVRWLEHAARPNGAGELLAAPIGGQPLHLTLNTRQWEELPDGRILADADHAYRGTQNRIVVVDEKSRTAKWVAASAASYTHIPGSDDLLVDVITGPTAYDIVRVSIPPPDPAP